MNSSERDWMKRARFLTLSLIFSGTLNIGFLSAFIYSSGKDNKLFQEVVPQEKTQFTNQQVLRAYSCASFADLVLRLESKEMIEDGYAKRDLALACLSAFHDFAVEQALGGIALQRRVLSFQAGLDQIEIEAFAGLQDDHFDAILQFIRIEKWPFTAKGLFKEICQSKYPYDPSLLEAFYCKSEFHRLYSLAQKYDPFVQRPLFVSLLKEGSWSLLQKFSERILLDQSYTEEMWQEFLTTYVLQAHSRIAADCLWRGEKEYLLKRWDDAQLSVFLDFLQEQKPRQEALATQLLTSPRSDSIRQKAAQILCLQIGSEPAGCCENRECVLTLPLEQKEKNVHIVQAGDSLWKISRKYGVSIDSIIRENSLESDRLKVGRKIRIPER